FPQFTFTSSILHLQCHLHHRALHSFPTRRSSDLTFSSRGVNVARTSSVISRRLDATTASEGLRIDLSSMKSPRCESSSSPIGVSDRKSTRLNSSHQIISYAVFCLKKKKQKKKYYR